MPHTFLVARTISSGVGADSHGMTQNPGITQKSEIGVHKSERVERGYLWLSGMAYIPTYKIISSSDRRPLIEKFAEDLTDQSGNHGM